MLRRMWRKVLKKLPKKPKMQNARSKMQPRTSRMLLREAKRRVNLNIKPICE